MVSTKAFEKRILQNNKTIKRESERSNIRLYNVEIDELMCSHYKQRDLATKIYVQKILEIP